MVYASNRIIHPKHVISRQLDSPMSASDPGTENRLMNTSEASSSTLKLAGNCDVTHVDELYRVSDDELKSITSTTSYSW